MAKGRKSRTNSEKVSLEMTPMIDVVFQLLIFFIVTLKQDDILAQLEAMRPQPDPSPNKDVKEPLTILIGIQGLYFEGNIVTETRLKSSLERIARMNKDTTVIIKCEDRSRHGTLVRALDICNDVGLRKLSVFSM